MYAFSEFRYLAYVSPSTERNGLFGYAGGHGGQVAPLFARRDETVAMVSFLQLIEIVVAGNFRKQNTWVFRRSAGLMKTRRPNGTLSILSHMFALNRWVATLRSGYGASGQAVACKV